MNHVRVRIGKFPNLKELKEGKDFKIENNTLVLAEHIAPGTRYFDLSFTYSPKE